MNRGAEGKTGKVFVADISEEKAMELAGKFVSESFVWAVCPTSMSHLQFPSCTCACVCYVGCAQLLSSSQEHQKREA